MAATRKATAAAASRISQLLTGGGPNDMSKEEMVVLAEHLINKLEAVDKKEEVGKVAKAVTRIVMNDSDSCPTGFTTEDSASYVARVTAQGGVYGPQLMVGTDAFCVPEGVTKWSALSPALQSRMGQSVLDEVTKVAKVDGMQNVAIKLECSIDPNLRSMKECNAAEGCGFFINGCHDIKVIANQLGIKDVDNKTTKELQAAVQEWLENGPQQKKAKAAAAGTSP